MLTVMGGDRSASTGVQNRKERRSAPILYEFCGTSLAISACDAPVDGRVRRRRARAASAGLLGNRAVLAVKLHCLNARPHPATQLALGPTTGPAALLGVSGGGLGPGRYVGHVIWQYIDM